MTRRRAEPRRRSDRYCSQRLRQSPPPAVPIELNIKSVDDEFEIATVISDGAPAVTSPKIIVGLEIARAGVAGTSACPLALRRPATVTIASAIAMATIKPTPSASARPFNIGHLPTAAPKTASCR